MPLEIIDVLDSAVKIGLGAAIAAIASYKSNRANHANEKNKELRSHKIKTIETIAEKFDRFINSQNQFRSKLNYTLGKNRKTEGEYDLDVKHLENLIDADKDLILSLESVTTACTRLKLIRADKAEIELMKIHELVVNMRNRIMIQRKAPSAEDFKEWISKLKDGTTRFHSELASLYSDIS